MSARLSIHIRIDGQPVSCAPTDRLLDALRRAGADRRVPTLCFSPGSAPQGGCRLCLVEVAGRERPVAACHTRVAEGQDVRTTSAALTVMRKGLLQLWADATPAAAAAPAAGGHDREQFRSLLAEYGVATLGRLPAAGPLRAEHPYLRFDPGRCLVCRRCIDACDDRQGQFVYAIGERGAASRLIFGADEDFPGSPCVSCGACVEVCPTGALFDVDREVVGQSVSGEVAPVRTVCGYCGVGCNLDVAVTRGVVATITGTPAAAVNAGHLCAKGRYAHAWQKSAERLTEPLLREGNGFRPIGWDEATRWVADRLLAIRDAHGPAALGVMTSSRSTNESAYLLQKLFRTMLGTNNVDCCARVCHSSTALALQLMTGTGAATASYADIERAKLIVIAGANPTEAHPVVGARIKQAVRRGARLIVIDPRTIELAEYAELHLRLTPGTNVALFNALGRVLIEEDLVDHAYLAERTVGLATLRESLLADDLDGAGMTCGVPVEFIREAGRLIGRSAGAGGGLYVTGLGLSELTQGTASVMTLTNLALLTGSIGRPGAGMLPLRGQNNVQGNADMGGMPNQVTGYQRVDADDVRERVGAIWGRAIPPEPGLTIPEMLASAAGGAIRGLWIQGEDVAQSDPDEKHVRSALEKLELLVVQELFMSETARYAHLVLPAAAALEQDGTFTNAERRIQRVRAALPPPGHARPDWIAVRDVANALGACWNYAAPAEVMDEIARVAPALFGGVSFARLEGDGLQWPCPAPGHPGTATVHGDSFVNGRGRLMAVAYEPTPEARTPGYPFLLITGRVLHHYNVGTMTRRTPSRTLVDADYLEIHPLDAAAAGIPAGGSVRLESRHGHATVPARITRRVSPGVLFLSFHFPETHANALTSSLGDPSSRCPEYKVTAVRIAGVG